MNEQERRKALYDAMGSIDPALVRNKWLSSTNTE